MSGQSPTVERTVAGALICLLSLVVLLGATAEPPIVDVSSLKSLDDGSTIRLEGIIVDVRVYPSGSEGVTVADLNDGATVRVISTPGVKPQPSQYAHVGDDVLVKGELSMEESTPVIFTTSDGLAVLRSSEMILTVGAVSQNWILFEGDTIRIKGYLVSTGYGTGLRLRDLSGTSSIVVLSDGLDVGRFAGVTATLTATLEFDHDANVLMLRPIYIVVEQ